MKKHLLYSSSFTKQVSKKASVVPFKIFCFIFFSFIFGQSFSQSLPPPSSCTSKDLELVGASLPPVNAQNPCSCEETRTLKLSIRNKTGSTRTSFAFWGILKSYDRDGVLVDSTPISGCNGPIPKNATTALNFNQIPIHCDFSYKLTDLFLAWTSASPGETCPLDPSTISPKCGTLPSIQVLAGVAADAVLTNPTCNGGTGSIDLTPFGGLAPYTFTWSASNGGVVPTGQEHHEDLTGLVSGTYTVLITDANGCTGTQERTVAVPSALSLGVCSKTDVACFGASTGSVTAGTVSNAVGTVHYSWKNSSSQVVGTTTSVNNLPAGSYTLTVTDTCTSKTCTVTISQPAGSLSLGTCSKTDVACFGASTGSVTAGTVSNNVGTVSYSWKNSSNVGVGTTATVNNLAAGTYTLTVTDSCFSRTCTVTVGQPAAALSLGTCTKTDVACFGASTGSVTAGTVSNNVGTVNYSWKDAQNNVVGTTATVNNLPAGSYTLTVTDNCFSRTCTVTIGQPAAALSLGTCSKTDVTCNGGSNGSVTAGTVTHNVGTVTYSWKNSSNTVVGTTASVNNLPAGTYTLTVTDNCFSRTCTVNVGQPADPLTLGTCTKTDASCTALGSVSAGAVTNNIGTIHYSWKNSSNAIVGATAIVSNLSPDTYTLTVTDNCSSETCSVTVNGPAELSAPTVCLVEPTLCGTAGSVTITSPAPGAEVEFSIDNGNTWQASNVFSNLGGGSVTGIRVRIGGEDGCLSPAADCSVSDCSQQPSMRKTGGNEESISKSNNIVPVKSSELVVKAYPNPFNDRVRFVITSPEAGRGSLEVLNVLGQKIKTVYDGQIVAGSQSFELILTTAQQSTLFYIFRMKDKQVTGKLIALGQ